MKEGVVCPQTLILHTAMRWLMESGKTGLISSVCCCLQLKFLVWLALLGLTLVQSCSLHLRSVLSEASEESRSHVKGSAAAEAVAEEVEVAMAVAEGKFLPAKRIWFLV
ncbi:hypothetical protein Hanom_Chr08g00709641 [Helianthus anomalus]